MMVRSHFSCCDVPARNSSDHIEEEYNGVKNGVSCVRSIVRWCFCSCKTHKAHHPRTFDARYHRMIMRLRQRWLFDFADDKPRIMNRCH